MRMMIRAVLAAASAVMVLTGIAEARPGDKIRERIAQRMTQRMTQGSASDNAPEAPAGQTIVYGNDPLQSLNFWGAQGVTGKAPLVIFVHGGGWKRGSADNAKGRWKAVHYPAEGYAFASINYRLVPEATVEQQAQDVADSLKALLARADALGIDRSRVVLMGHSAGAHLVALVGTDERYLRAAGLSFADVAGVIPIDGAAYDVVAQMNDGPQMMQQTYAQAFGTDPVRQRALSPTLQAAAPNAARFYVPHVQREDGVRQSQELVAALKGAGTAAREEGFPGAGLMGHMEINRRLGDPDYAATGAVDAWLKGVFGH
jgi:arylformamidase